jgi:hypothetical protein
VGSVTGLLLMLFHFLIICVTREEAYFDRDWELTYYTLFITLFICSEGIPNNRYLSNETLRGMRILKVSLVCITTTTTTTTL